MDLAFVLLYTAVGTVVGALVVGLLVRPRSASPVTAAELMLLKDQLQTSETALAAATSDLKALRSRAAEQDQALQQNGEEWQRRFDRAVEQLEDETGRRSAAEQRAQEMAAHVAALTEQCAAMEANTKADGPEAGEVEALRAQIAALEAAAPAQSPDAGEVDALRARVGDQEAQIAELQAAASAHGAAAGEVEALRAQIAALEAAAPVQSPDAGKVEALRTRLAGQAAEIARLEARHSEMALTAAAEVEELRARIEERDGEAAALAAKCAEADVLQARLAEQETEIARSAAVAAEMEALRSQVAGQESEIARLTAKNSESALAAAADVEELRTRVGEQDAQISALTEQCGAVEGLRAQAAATLDEKESQLGRALEDLRAAEARAQEAERSAKAAGANIEALRARVLEQDQALAEHAGETAAERAGREVADRRSEELAAQAAILTAQSGALSGQVAQLTGELEEQARRGTVLRSQLAAEREQTRTLAIRVAELESAYAHLDAKVRSERQSAAETMDFIARAHDKLAHAIQALGGEAQGNGSPDRPRASAKTNGVEALSADS